MNKETVYLQCVSALLNSWVKKYNGSYYHEDDKVSSVFPAIFVNVDEENWNHIFKECQTKKYVSVSDIKQLTDVINKAVNKNTIIVNFSSNTWLYCGRIYPVLTTNICKISDMSLKDLPFKLR